MKVIKTGGAEITLGTAQAAPTISMTDYSRRVTDDFGVTTVVKRGFARKMAVRFALPFDDVSRVQSELAGLRGSAARWEVDADVDWLNFEGFYKDFDIDHAVPPLSFCSLTVEGLAEVEPGTDDGSDPAADGVSTLLVLQPVEITGFTSNNVPENDYSEWSAGVSYALGSRVIKAATHRIYESAGGGNVGNDPAGASGLWIDIGPTNRWAMLDKALGTATAQASNIILSISPGDVSAIALLDVVATSVRVQKSGYDQTRSASDGSVNFFDLPTGSGSITITISGSGTVSVGTMLVGNLTGLGNSGEAPTAGITDYSRKEVDDFGDTTIVERAWAKRMATKALIKNASVDKVCNRIAALRGAPVLWMADEGTDSLSVYGFFKDFSIEVGESVSTLSLSIEGLSKAAPIGSTITAEIQAALDILAAATGKVTYGGPLPSAANSSVGDLHVGDDGTFYERVGGGGILLDGKVVVLAGYRPVLPWTLTASQPLRDTIATANEAYSNANDAIDQLIGLADDGNISINEKITKLIPEQARLDEKYTVLAGQATGLAVSTTAAAAAKATWDAMLAGLSPAWNNVTADSPVVRATFDAARNGFDSALYDLDAAIKTKAATIANWSGIADDNGNRPDDNATRNRMRGNYSGIATYAPGDTVLWLVADGGTGTGFTRIGSGDTSGVNPADATKWMPFAEEGQDGSLMIRETLPAFDTVKVGQKVMLADGLIYRRVGSGGILLDGKVIVLAGYRPVLPWTLESTQPVAAGIRYGLQAIDEAQAAQASADLANAAIANIDDDAIITISEKVETLIPGAAAFAALYTAVAANAAVAGVSMTTLNSKRTAWLGALAAVSPAWNDASQASPVTRNALDTARNEYDAELKETQRLAIEAMTAAQQVVIVPPVPQIVYRDWQGYIKSGQYNRPLVPKVERGGVDIRDDNDVNYSISTTGSIVATVNNTTGSADKGKITATDGSSGSIILTVTVAGVSFPTFTIPFTNQDDNPPTTGGGGSGNPGGSDSTLEDVTSTSFTAITRQDGGESVFLIDITSGQTLHGTAPLTYQKSGSNTTATALTGKWQYRLQGDPTWLDFTGSAITGSGAYWNDVDFAAETGDATVNQSKASLATGTYEVQLVAAKSNSAAGNLQIILGTATVSRT
jgi:hypothetical protein